MANLTIVIDDHVLRAARVKAVAQGTSVNEIGRKAIVELYAAPTRKAGHAADAALDVIGGLAKERVVQAALDAGCTTLLSKDLQTGARFRPPTVVDPFDQALQAPSPPCGARRRSGPRARRRAAAD